ncbi:hypothetical protein FVEG_13114 [Fusarium verticillioides 7600]|uniref:Uncharacterized protein n=1 Tax=Gibberella moniliformis (strain M3125 / FGSC 7600) TaxID=334819 RepID=W7N4R8_GIBM7|nr:hypothetical protein FVEG_13114 [Fusarium verticillioides 7600]EWG55060.1 hypothetical protein FVEG_13114 [Fusarium verticillioides 7600]
MSRHSKRSTRKVGFLDALGQWTMGPSLKRSSRCRRHPRSTTATREARLANAPKDLNLTARQWRQYADVPPEPQDECDCSDCGEDHSDDEQTPLMSGEPVQRICSKWSHSEGSAFTRKPEPVHRDSGLNRILGRVEAEMAEEQRLRHRVSYDAGNDALFANIPRRDQRTQGEFIVHRHRLGDGEDFLAVDTFGHGDSGHREADVQSVRSSQFFENPREAPAVPPDAWTPSVQHVPESAKTRIQSWRDCVDDGPEPEPEPSVFGGSNAPTVWPGSGETIVPDDSLTEVVVRNSRGSSKKESKGRGSRRHSKRK